MNTKLARLLTGVIPHRKTRRQLRDRLLGTESGRDEGIIDLLSEYQVIVSYAQFAEDVILYKYLHHVKNGFYVDVGAAHPEDLSVTKLFYDRGWSGINIEPRQELIDYYMQVRSRDINLNMGVSNCQGTANLFEAGDGSTFSVDGAKRFGLTESTAVNIDLLSNVLAKHPQPDIHFLKIDVEDHEKEVLEGMDFSTTRPWILAIESTLPNTNVATYEQWENILLRNKYTLLTRHYINRYYVSEERKDEICSKALDMNKLRYLRIDDYRKLNTPSG